MSPATIDQALFGYSRGHGLLAASRALDPESSRLLRTATDMSFEGSSREFITVMPLPKMRAQAIVKTWPAEDWLRPGSVWSHVLLVDFATLGKLRSFHALTTCFRRPAVGSPSALANQIVMYEQAVPVPDDDARTWAVDPILADQVARAIYADRDDKRIELVAKLEIAEPTLWAVYEQQWPSLRRTFAFRTRHRPAASQVTVDLEVTERGAKSASAPQQALPSVIHSDLVSPNPRFRDFLLRYGSQSTRGRIDMVPLAAVFEAAGDLDALAVRRILVDEFPAPDSMAALKRDLLNTPGQGEALWSADEQTRLSLAFDLLGHFESANLGIGRRLSALHPDASRRILARLEIDELSSEQLRELVNELLPPGDPSTTAAIALTNPDLGLILAARNPSILGIAAMWNALDGELLRTIFAAAPGATQTQILADLIREQADEAITKLVFGAMDVWWRALQYVARGEKVSTVVPNVAVLRRVVERVGAGALGPSPHEIRTLPEMLALLLAADLRTGLWRRITADRWIDAWVQFAKSDSGSQVPSFVADRLATVALVAASNGSSSITRARGWTEVFAGLHSALGRADFDDEAWATLSGALPSGPDWDRCLRLRRGAAAEVRRDHWSPAAVQTLINASGEFASEIASTIQEEAVRARKRGLLERAVDAFLGRS